MSVWIDGLLVIACNVTVKIIVIVFLKFSLILSVWLSQNSVSSRFILGYIEIPLWFWVLKKNKMWRYQINPVNQCLISPVTLEFREDEFWHWVSGWLSNEPIKGFKKYFSTNQKFQDVIFNQTNGKTIFFQGSKSMLLRSKRNRWYMRSNLVNFQSFL